MNYFAYQSAARRYASSRPYFHPVVIEKIKTFLRLQEPISRVLDVGCGTGRSSLALTAISSQVVGVDPSQAMVDQAPCHVQIRYVLAPAEQLPFPDASFDMITVASAFHWFDRACFLSEAARLLPVSGWLVIYGNGFKKAMQENAAFQRWNESYLSRYPSPPRNNQPLTQAELQKYSLRSIEKETYTNEVTFSLQELASYLMTQTNAIAVLEQERERPENLYTLLLDELAPLFLTPKCTFLFGGTIEYIQKE